jgi:prevent-host-death family protein
MPIGKFKNKRSRWLNITKATEHPLIITKNGKSAAVVMSPEAIDKLNDTKRFMNSVNQGLAEIDTGNSFDSKELKSELNKLRSERD